MSYGAPDFSDYDQTNSGIWTPKNSPGTVLGLFGKSVYDFNGVNQYCTSSQYPTDNGDGANLGVSCWVRKNDTGTTGFILAQRAASTQGAKSGWWNNHTSGDATEIAAFTGSISNLTTQQKSGAWNTDGEWHHLFTRFEGGKSFIYVDAVNQGQVIDAGWTGPNNQPEPLSMGGDADGNQTLYGNVDGIQIWKNQTFTDADVQAIYDADVALMGPSRRSRLLRGIL